mmetsp:Transcript_38546/g.65858  ORF Transcript_38546/g.65858 Transcript_38546/m.65858 type:complete len:100 (-) Transcript_38546:184-483(-)
MAVRNDPIQGYDNDRIRSSAPGIPNIRKHVNSGNMSTTPDDVNTRTMSEVTDVIRKNARVDRNTTPSFPTSFSAKVRCSNIWSCSLCHPHLSCVSMDFT